MKHKPLPPLEELKEYLDYNPDTGILTWIKAKARARPELVGKEAGSDGRKTSTYREITFNGESYRIHRIAYYMYHARDPLQFDVDHKDLDTYNNKINNLRLATTQQNSFNRGISKTNTSGFTGVVWDKRDKRWRAKICPNGKQIHLGNFINKEDAIQARKEGEKKYFGRFRRKD